jgi:hypothetical protein
LFFLVCHSRRESAFVLAVAVAFAVVFAVAFAVVFAVAFAVVSAVAFAVVFSVAVAVACSLFVISEGNLLLLLSLPLSGKRQRRVLYSA